MTQIIQQLRPKPADSEKITINLGYVDLGQIDLMVQEGFYSNRTDFIRSAIRNQLERHADVVKQSTVRKSLDLGLRHYSREDLEAARRAGQMLQIHVLGLASIALDVTPELARATIASVVVLGSLHASPAVKACAGRQDAVTRDAALDLDAISNGDKSGPVRTLDCSTERFGDKRHAESEYDARSHAPYARGPAHRSHGAPSAHASRRDRSGHEFRQRR